MIVANLIGAKASTTIDFTLHECGGCGIPYMVPTAWITKKVNELASFYCPNGCSRRFTGKTDAQKLQEQLEETKREAARENERLVNMALDAMNKQKAAEKKLKRVQNGVCPCCNRTFANLQQHIIMMHPEGVVIEKKKRGRPKKVIG